MLCRRAYESGVTAGFCGRLKAGQGALHERNPENCGDSRLGCRRLQPARRSGRRAHSGAAQGSAQRSHRSHDLPSTTAAIVKRTGDGSIIEFRSVVDAVRCAIEVQHAMVERNAGVAPDKRIEFRIGIHLGDVVEESRRRPYGRWGQHRLAARGRSASPAGFASRARPMSRSEIGSRKASSISARSSSRTSPGRCASMRCSPAAIAAVEIGSRNCLRAPPKAVQRLAAPWR